MQKLCSTLCVYSFYESNDISYVKPGKKDFISVEKKGKCEHIQKRLVLADSRGVHREFKEKFPDCKIGVLKFAELIPKLYILAGTSGTYSVCMCTMYQNVKLSYQHTITV